MAPVLIVAVCQAGSAYYAYSMLAWYYGMAIRNMHAVEESMTGTIYNKADYWGLTGENHKEGEQVPNHDACCDNKRIFLYTKKSRYSNMMSMLQARNIYYTLLPLPYDFMQRLGSFETGKSNIDSCLWMMQDTESFKNLADLEWLAEAKNREDLVKNGFKIKKLGTPMWVQFKCGKDVFKRHN